MDLQWLLTFQAILNTGSYTKAAERLGYTQSTITAQIHHLEDELSVQLFEKIGKKVCLTSAGRQCLPEINQIVTLMNELKARNSVSKQAHGRLNISVEETLLNQGMNLMLQEYIERMPEMVIHIDTDRSCTQAREQIKSGDLDIGILYQDPADRRTDPLIIETPLARIRLSLVASNHHDVDWDEEKGVPTSRNVVYFNDSKCIFHDMFNRYLSSRHVSTDHIISLGTTRANLECVAGGKGIAYMPQYIVKDQLESGELRELHMDTAESFAYITWAVHKNKWISPGIELFIDLLKEHITGKFPPDL